MKRLRRHLTYANVMASIAVFLVLGGGAAYAAKKIGSNEIKANAITTAKIKKNAVTTAKIKKDAVTGAKVKESTLGEVPSAGNANAVNGQSASKLFKTLTVGQSNVEVATVAGFRITASCEASNADVEITSPSGPATVMQAGGEIRSTNETVYDYDGSKAGETGSIEVDGLSEGGGNDAAYGISTVALATSTGTTVSGVIGYDYDTFGGESPERCIVYGHLLAG